MKDKKGTELSFNSLLTKVLNRIANILLEFNVMFFRWVGHIPSHHIRRFFYRMSGMKVGRGSTIHMWTNFFDPTQIEIGEDTIVGEGALLDGRARLTIGNHVAIASDVMIYNSEHDVQSSDFRPITAPVTIEDYVFIGPRVIILPGLRIGKGAVVAAGAVVTKDVEPMTIVGGVPAKPIGQRSVQNFNYKLGRARWFR